jgi:hypothetical protein
VRTLFRAVYDATRERTGVQEDPDYADDVRRSAAIVMRRMGDVVRAFGRLLHSEMTTSGELERERLAWTLDELRVARSEVVELLLADPRSRDGLWELNSALLTTADRMLSKLDVAAHARLRASRNAALSTRDRARHAAERLRRTNRHRVDRAGPPPAHTSEDPEAGEPIS